MSETKLSIDEVVARIAHDRGFTLASAAELLRADPELAESVHELEDPPPIDPAPVPPAAS